MPKGFRPVVAVREFTRRASSAHGLRRWRLACAAILAAIALPALTGCEAPPGADMIVTHARIWTGVPGAADVPAMAITDGRIVAIGSYEEVMSHAGGDTLRIDARDRRIVPGITDSHIHTIGGGLQLARLNLRDVPDRDAFVAAVATAADEASPGEWILGGRWSVDSWSHESPTRHWIDEATGDVPAFLNRMDGHQALVNSAALKLAGIDASGPNDPVGGEIERDRATGEPTGILKESAMDLVSQHIPPPTDRQLDEALTRAMRHLNAHGITAVHDMSDPSHLPVFERAAAAGTLTLRVRSYVSTEDWDGWGDRVRNMKQRPGPTGVAAWDPHMFEVAGFKGYMDGSLGSRTAYMREPFADVDDHTRYPRGQRTAFTADQQAFERIVADADARGLQLAVHAIGDEGNHLVLNSYEAAAVANGEHDARHRIEHAQHLLVEDIPRFVPLGVVASMQPFHKADDGRYAEQALGPSRLPGSYAFRPLLDAGAVVAFGSDWPVVTADPFAGMHAAVNSRTLDHVVWLPENAVRPREALYAYTVAPAWAGHAEAYRGTLEVGKAADFTMLSTDVLRAPPSQIVGTRCVMTVVAGRIVYSH